MNSVALVCAMIIVIAAALVGCSFQICRGVSPRRIRARGTRVPTYADDMSALPRIGEAIGGWEKSRAGHMLNVAI